MGASTNLKCAKSSAGLESGMEHIILLVKYQAKQQMREKFIEEVTNAGILEAVLQEDGCVQYQYYLDAQEKDTILLVEEWQSQTKQEVHLQSPHMKTLQKLKEQYIADTEVQKLSHQALETKLPDTFRPMRRIRQEVSKEECIEILTKEKRAALSVIGENGYPYAIPIDFYYEASDNVIYFHCAKEGHKIDAIQKNNRVCFTTWNTGFQTEDDWAFNVTSVVVFGMAELVEDEQKTVEKIRKLAMKYYPTIEEVESEMKKAINWAQLVAIRIDHMTGKLVNEK